MLIHDGCYRELVVVKASGTANSPIHFEAAPGAYVVISGADPVHGWQKLQGARPVYQVPWTLRFNSWSKTMAHSDDEYHRLIGVSWLQESATR